MDKRIIKTKQAPEPVGAYNQAVWSRDTLYISGQIALDPFAEGMLQDDIKSETRQVMRNISAILQAAGLDFNHVVKCSIFLQDMDDFKSVNEVYSGFFDPASAPAREAVEVSRLPKGANVEISAIAVK